MAKLRIALTKGRLEKKAVNLFEKVGFNCEELNDKGRKLVLNVGDFEAVLAKADDVITYVTHGVCDMGIVGYDTLVEKGGDFYEVANLNFGKCKMAVASLNKGDLDPNIKTIATKYPNTAAGFFESENRDVKIIKIEGSVELAPILNLADAIVDIVETGATLKENGLFVNREIMPISARLIVNMASFKLKKAEIDAVLNKIRGEINAN